MTEPKKSTQDERRTTVSNLIAVMSADGKITSEEKKYLQQVCAREGINLEEFEHMVSTQERFVFTPAPDMQGRIKQLFDAIFMMLIDGEMDTSEIRTCVDLGEMLGFLKEDVRKAINIIANGVENKEPIGEVVARAKACL